MEFPVLPRVSHDRVLKPDGDAAVALEIAQNLASLSVIRLGAEFSLVGDAIADDIEREWGTLFDQVCVSHCERRARGWTFPSRELFVQLGRYLCRVHSGDLAFELLWPRVRNALMGLATSWPLRDAWQVPPGHPVPFPTREELSEFENTTWGDVARLDIKPVRVPRS